jgi:hypothetical protein
MIDLRDVTAETRITFTLGNREVTTGDHSKRADGRQRARL